MIVALRTDNPDAELALCDGQTIVQHITWPAHRQLAETIHDKLAELRQAHGVDNVSGVVVYHGPGSFTGLRIGVSVANALAYAHSVPVVGVSGDDWLQHGLDRLVQGNNDHAVVPDYGAPVHITQQKK